MPSSIFTSSILVPSSILTSIIKVISTAMHQITTDLGDLRMSSLVQHPLLQSYDFIAKLPLELVLMIAERLSLQAFARYLRVSKTWRWRLLSGPGRTAFAKRHWPALFSSGTDSTRFMKVLTRLGSLLHSDGFDVNARAYWDASRFIRYDRSGSLFYSHDDSHHRLDPISHGHVGSVSRHYFRNYRFVRPLLYRCGKVAFCLGYQIVVIDDLRSRTRKILAPPGSIVSPYALNLLALGSRLVVASVDNKIIAWDHIRNQTYEKELSSLPHMCATHEYNVAIRLIEGGLVIWTLGGPRLDIPFPTPLATEGSREVAHFLCFNTHEERTFYHATAHYSRGLAGHMISITVNEFSAASYKKTYTYEHAGFGILPDREGPIGLSVREHDFDRKLIYFLAPDFLPVGFDQLERKFSCQNMPWEKVKYTLQSMVFFRLLYGVHTDKDDLDWFVRCELGNIQYRIIRFDVPNQILRKRRWD